MAIESIQETHAHAQFTANRSGHNWTCPYTVTVSSPRVGPLEIVNYFNHTIGRGIDSYMVYADETDPFAFCDSIAPVKRDRSGTVWDVTLLYSTPTSDREDREQRDWRDADGNPVRDPFAWRGDMVITTQYVQVPVWKAVNIDAFPIDATAGTYVRPAGHLGPVVNSAGVVLDPPLMTNYPERVIMITRNVPEWDDTYARLNENHINWSPVQFAPGIIQRFYVHQRKFDTYSVKCTSVQGTFGQVTDDSGNSVKYWKVTVELRIRLRSPDGDPFDGWLESVLDRGLTRGAAVGDPDGTGGQYASGDLESGMARATPARGPDGSRVGELVLLDGAGQPLTDMSGTDAQQGVYCRWRVNPTTSFLLMPFQIFELA